MENIKIFKENTLIHMPPEIIIDIFSKIDIQDIIHLRFVNHSFLQYINQKSFLNKLGEDLLHTNVSNFSEFIKMYHCQHVTTLSRRYFSKEECLVQAATTGNITMAKMYHDLGANNIEDYFLTSCISGHKENFELLKQWSYQPNREIIDTAIQVCVEHNQLQSLDYFDVKYTDFQKRAMILIWSINSGNLEMIEKLTEENDPVMLLFFGFNIAICNSDIKIAVYLLNYKDGMLRKTYPLVALKILCGESTLYTFIKLLKYFDLSIINDNVIGVLAYEGKYEIVKHLHENGLVMFDQFHWDMFLLQNKSSPLRTYSILHGAQLYSGAVQHLMITKDYDLLSTLFNKDDIFSYTVSDDYILKLHERNRYYVVPAHSNTILQYINIKFIKHKYDLSDIDSQVTPNLMMKIACEIGNMTWLNKALQNGSNSYLTCLYLSSKNNQEQIKDTLVNRMFSYI